MRTKANQHLIDLISGLRIVTAIALILSTASCVVAPVKSMYYDEECNRYRKSVSLEMVNPPFKKTTQTKTSKKRSQNPPIHTPHVPKDRQCSGSDCAGRLLSPVMAGMAVVPVMAVSALASIPIAIAGNLYYKLNDSGECVKDIALQNEDLIEDTVIVAKPAKGIDL